ncbi:hypothetical protein [Flavisphingomonas formosensis]|uniref:hypothetical protein n=1 Tax=Flavisphingomonas formosensis TaxID=861534 RepID=UPI0012F9855C|nr:hypothetical protein [Sphingomonas formosensis]
MAKVRDSKGREVDFAAAQRLMNSALLQELQASGTYLDSQAIFEAYAQAHARKYRQSFAPFTGGRW